MRLEPSTGHVEANGEKYYVEPASTSEETYTLLQLQRFEPDTSKDGLWDTMKMKMKMKTKRRIKNMD